MNIAAVNIKPTFQPIMNPAKLLSQPYCISAKLPNQAQKQELLRVKTNFNPEHFKCHGKQIRKTNLT